MNKRGKYTIDLGPDRKFTLTLDLHVASLFEKAYKERFGVKVTTLKWLSDASEWEADQLTLFLSIAFKPDHPEMTEDVIRHGFDISEINEISYRVGLILESAASEELKKKRDEIQAKTIDALTRQLMEKKAQSAPTT